MGLAILVPAAVLWIGSRAPAQGSSAAPARPLAAPVSPNPTTPAASPPVAGAQAASSSQQCGGITDPICYVIDAFISGPVAIMGSLDGSPDPAHIDPLTGAVTAGPWRLILVDEAEVLLSSARSAVALEGLSRRLRKLGAGLLVVSQVVEDFLNSEVGNVIIRNCHTKLLLRQEEVAIPALRQAFGLSPAECDLLRDAEPGSGLVLVGRERAAFAGSAPPAWHDALSTDARPLRPASPA